MTQERQDPLVRKVAEVMLALRVHVVFKDHLVELVPLETRVVEELLDGLEDLAIMEPKEIRVH